MEARGVRKQQGLCLLSLPIIEILVVGEVLGQVHDMHHSGHVCVNQANELEITGSRESYGIR